MTRSFLRSAVLRKLSTVLVAALTVSLQLAGFAHLALEKHEVCAEHGQAVDTARSNHAHAALAGPYAPAPKEHAVRGGEGSALGAHAHCPIVAEHRDDAALVPAAYAIHRASLDPIATVMPQGSWSMAPSELRLRAPKTSPPA